MKFGLDSWNIFGFRQKTNDTSDAAATNPLQDPCSGPVLKLVLLLSMLLLIFNVFWLLILSSSGSFGTTSTSINIFRPAKNSLYMNESENSDDTKLTIHNRDIEKWERQDVIWYFHHIPKCAGTATEKAMRSSKTFAKKVVRDDGIKGPSYAIFKEPTDVMEVCGNLLHKTQKQPPKGAVITGHWPQGGLCRYPQLTNDPRHHKIFAIVRDPWLTRVSLYWYHRRNGYIPKSTDIVKYMLSDPETMKMIREFGNQRPHRYWYAQEPMVVDYLPYYFKCNHPEQCKSVLDKYSFLGVLGIKEAPNPMLPLAFLKIGSVKGAPNLSNWKNTNRRVVSGGGESVLHYNKAMKILDTKENREKFKKLNALDYFVYHECLQRYMYDWNKTMVSV